jgi:hypothetical protein
MMNLKIPFVLTVVLAFCALGTTKAQLTTGVPVVVDVGNTNSPYVSYLVIDDQSLGNSAIEYAWYYSSNTENGTTNPLTGDDLVNAVVAGTATNSRYALTLITEGGAGVDAGVDGFKIGSTTSTIVSPYDYSATNYWIYWINGGSQTASWTNNYTVTPTNWIVAPDTAFDRILANGSYDGWSLDPYDSSTYTLSGLPPLSLAAVPEPATLPLIILSLATVFAVIRWKSADRNSTL